MQTRQRLGLVVSCAAALGVAAVAAHGGVFDAGPEGQVSPQEARALVVAGESGVFSDSLRDQQTRLQLERSYYPVLFRAAYARYPRLAAGSLEALAYSQTRWHNVRPQPQDNAHMPQAYGVMGLYAGDGFADQVGEASSLLGVSAELIRQNPHYNILAAAALLDREMRGGNGDMAALGQALQRYVGFGGPRSKVQDYARASFAFDVLLGLDRGVNDNGIRVPERAVAWEEVFPADMLVKLNAPMVRLDVGRDAVDTGAYRVDPITEQLVEKSSRVPMVVNQAAAVDFPSARWVYSPNFNSRSGTAVTEMVIHTMQGSYAGSIAWFQNSASQVSSHYLIRSSDGQVTQMVRESNRAWHAGNHNSHDIGIEHEGYINNPSWYTTAMYNASAAITRQSCARYAGITCTRTLRSYTSAKLSDATYDIMGHVNLSGNSHTDPGQYWNWSRYYDLLNPGTPPTGSTVILDGFESSVGHFTTSPTYSGSTVGISAASTSSRNCSMRYSGSCSLNLRLVDNAGTSAAWAARHLSGAGTPGSNVGLSRSGRVGFYVYSGGSGVSVGVGIDDSDGTERSVSKAIPANAWTYVEWNLADAAQWNAWAGNSNGTISASTVQLDAIWFYHANTSYDVQLYIDNVQHKK